MKSGRGAACCALLHPGRGAWSAPCNARASVLAAVEGVNDRAGCIGFTVGIFSVAGVAVAGVIFF